MLCRFATTPLGYNPAQYKARPTGLSSLSIKARKLMNHAGTSRPATLRRIALPWVLALVGVAGAAHADDYTDVNQLLKNGKYSEALGKADMFLAGKARDPQMRFLKGVILTEMGRPADASNVFLALTQDFPELPEPYNNLAALYAQQNQFDKARAALEMAVRLNPNYAVAHENLGDVYARLASQSYSRALQLDNANAALPAKLTLIRSLFTPPKAAGRK
jgi:tetratricopeptide (TPR) repeat protein